MTPQEQAPADRRELEFQRRCEEAALDLMCDRRNEARLAILEEKSKAASK